MVILAGGVGSRMQLGSAAHTEPPVEVEVEVEVGPDGDARPGVDNKVYLTIGARGMLEHSIETVGRSPLVAHVVVVARPEDRARLDPLLRSAAGDTPVRITPGGASRHASERAGIVALRAQIEAGEIDVVAVHDGARPFVSADLLERVLTEAATSGGAIPGLMIDDTLYAIDQDAFVDSADYVWVQTPQAFDARTLLTAHDRAAEADHDGVDTAEVVQSFTDQRIRVVAGEPTNIKVTYRTDLARAEAIIADGLPGRRP